MRYLAAILAFTAWGVNSTLMLRALQAAGVAGPVCTFAGTAVGAVTMLLFIGEKGRVAAAQLLLDHPWRMAFQACAFSFTSMTYHLALLKTSVANAALTHSLQPIFTCLLFAPLFLHKRPSALETAAVLVGLAGMYVLLAPQLRWDGRWDGIAFGTLSAVCYSGSLLNVASFPKEVDRTILLAAILACGVPVLFPFAWAAGFPPLAAKTVAMLVPFGLVGYVLANALYFYALRRLGAGPVATLSYLEPVIAIAAGAIWLAEPVTASAVAGGGLILASSGLIAFDGLRHRPR